MHEVDPGWSTSSSSGLFILFFIQNESVPKNRVPTRNILEVLRCRGDGLQTVTVVDLCSKRRVACRARRCVEGVVARRPWQRAAEGGEEIIQRPGNDDVVVEGDVVGDKALRDSDSCQKYKGQVLKSEETESSAGSLS